MLYLYYILKGDSERDRGTNIYLWAHVCPGCCGNNVGLFGLTRALAETHQSCLRYHAINGVSDNAETLLIQHLLRCLRNCWCQISGVWQQHNWCCLRGVTDSADTKKTVLIQTIIVIGYFFLYQIYLKENAYYVHINHYTIESSKNFHSLWAWSGLSQTPFHRIPVS
jgi:hypothetical protein